MAFNLDSVTEKIPNRQGKTDKETGNLKRSYNMPSPKICKKSYKDLGYKSVQDCIDYKNTKKSSNSKSKKADY